MHEILIATYNLLDELDNSDIVRDMLYYKDRFKSNKEICDLLDRGRNTTDKYIIIDIKKKLYSYSDYKNYIDSYNKLFYIVIGINNRFNKLVSTRSCGR